MARTNLFKAVAILLAGAVWMTGQFTPSLSIISGNFTVNPIATLGGITVSSANDNIGLTMTNSGTGGRSYAIYGTGGGSGFGQGTLTISDVTASFANRISLTSIGLVKFGVAIAGASSQPAVNAASCTGATIGTGATNLAGTITGLPTGACSVIVTMANSAASSTGWSCAVSNQTTANLFRQTGSTTTTVTFAGTSVSGDVLAYGPCVGF